MPRVQKVLARANAGEIAETLLLKFDDRRRRQGFVFGSKGTCVEFDFPEPPLLRTDDLLVLDDGRLVEVVADIEPVIEVRIKDLATDFPAVARLLLALGNRHIPAQLLANRVRLQKNSEAETLVAAHGLKGAAIAAPFEPDDGAAQSAHDHAHGDGHGHHHHHGDEHGHGRHHHDDRRGHHHHDGQGHHHHHDE